MKILFVGINYAPEQIGIGPYSTGLAEALAAAGHEVKAIVAKPYYPAWRILPGYRRLGWRHSREGGVRVTRCPHYVPARPSGARRILHHAAFAASALIPALATAIWRRPKLVVTVAPAMVAVPVARLAARLAGATSWLHLQDFEVEAAFATGLLKEDSRAGRMATRFEEHTLKRFDHVSTISPQMVARLLDKGVAPERAHELRNWAEIDSIVPQAAPSPYRAEWGITAPHVALYSGNIANKQGIEIVVQAARALRHRPDILFAVCGDGPNRANLEALAAGLDNIRFFPLQPRERLGDLLNLATVHLLPQLAGAADLVLPSKLANMMASGRPVVASVEPGTGVADEVAGCGLLTPPGDAAAMADAITRLVDAPDEAARLGAAGRRRAEERWSRDRILARFTAALVAAAEAKAPK